RMQTLPSPAGGVLECSERHSLQQVLQELYLGQLALEPDNAYLINHGSPKSMADHIRTFHWYRPFLPSAGSILDWGCNHAPDSCLLRAWFGDGVSLHSCDFVGSDRFPVFHDFAQATHERLEDEVQLPYSANFFDA